MKRGIILALMLIALSACAQTEQGAHCPRYDSAEQISILAGINVSTPAKLHKTQDDCTAEYKTKDTTFDLYYWEYSSESKRNREYNHCLVYTSNCKGSLCDSIYQFHYIGPPRKLEIKCKNNKVWMNNSGEIKEKNIDCSVFRGIGKNNQKTWKCEYNQIINENCK